MTTSPLPAASGARCQIHETFTTIAYLGLRLLGFYSRAHMARCKDVLASSLPPEDAFPSLRRYHTPKTGVALSVEQQLTGDLSFTPVDRSIAAGVSIAGTGWGSRFPPTGCRTRIALWWRWRPGG